MWLSDALQPIQWCLFDGSQAILLTIKKNTNLLMHRHTYNDHIWSDGVGCVDARRYLQFFHIQFQIASALAAREIQAFPSNAPHLSSVLDDQCNSVASRSSFTSRPAVICEQWKCQVTFWCHEQSASAMKLFIKIETWLNCWRRTSCTSTCFIIPHATF